MAKAQICDGTLALITNTTDISPAAAVARYKGLADIERGFRVLKSDIDIAPVHHRLPDRIRAHALICFLALTLYRVTRMRLKAKGHSASPKTALEILAKVQRFTALYRGEAIYRNNSNQAGATVPLRSLGRLKACLNHLTLWQFWKSLQINSITYTNGPRY